MILEAVKGSRPPSCLQTSICHPSHGPKKRWGESHHISWAHVASAMLCALQACVSFCTPSSPASHIKPLSHSYICSLTSPTCQALYLPSHLRTLAHGVPSAGPVLSPHALRADSDLLWDSFSGRFTYVSCYSLSFRLVYFHRSSYHCLQLCVNILVWFMSVSLKMISSMRDLISSTL